MRSQDCGPSCCPPFVVDDGVHFWGHASSLDLLHWRHHPPSLLPTPDSPETGIFRATELDRWEYVGDLFKLGDKWVLVCISHRLGCRYCIGEWQDEQFHPEFHEQMSWTDNAYFAPESRVDDRGRCILWAWIFDGRDARPQES